MMVFDHYEEDVPKSVQEIIKKNKGEEIILEITLRMLFLFCLWNS